MSDQNRRDAADRLMDAITDLGDDLILAADEQKAKKAGKSPRARWVMIGISAAAVLLAGIISLGVFLGRRGKDERPPVDVSTAAGTEAGIIRIPEEDLFRGHRRTVRRRDVYHIRTAPFKNVIMITLLHYVSRVEEFDVVIKYHGRA